MAQVGGVCLARLESFVSFGRVQRTFHWVAKLICLAKVFDVTRNTGSVRVKHWQWIPCKATSPGAKDWNHEPVTKNAYDGKPPRGPIPSGWVGKVLGKSSDNAVGRGAPVPVPIDVDDDNVDSGRVGELDEFADDLDTKVAPNISMFGHVAGHSGHPWNEHADTL